MRSVTNKKRKKQRYQEPATTEGTEKELKVHGQHPHERSPHNGAAGLGIRDNYPAPNLGTQPVFWASREAPHTKPKVVACSDFY